MAKIKIQNLKNSINFAKIVKKLRCPTLIKHFVEGSSDKNLCDFYRIIANLIYNEGFYKNPAIRKNIVTNLIQVIQYALHITFEKYKSYY